MASFATYFTYGLWHGRESTIEEFRVALSQFARDPLIYLCSAINAILRCWQGGAPNVDAHAHLVLSLFQSDEAQRLIQGTKNQQQPHFVFHRQQLLFVAKEAILYCPARGIDPLSQPPGPVGTLFLMANDHLHYGFPQTNDYEQKLLNTLTELVVVGEYSGYHAFRNGIARAHLMYSRFSDELAGDPDYANIRDRFGALVGMPMDEFQGLCFALLWKYFNVTVESYAKDPNSMFLQQSYFAQTAISIENVNKLVAELSTTPEGFKKIFERRLKGKNDFTLFRSKPLCFVSDHLFCIDPGLLAEKLESGPFWRVHFSLLSDKEKESLHRFWGKLFERYMNWMLTQNIERATDSMRCIRALSTAMERKSVMPSFSVDLRRYSSNTKERRSQQKRSIRGIRRYSAERWNETSFKMSEVVQKALDNWRKLSVALAGGQIRSRSQISTCQMCAPSTRC